MPFEHGACGPKGTVEVGCRSGGRHAAGRSGRRLARGLPRPEAEALLVEAFLGEVLEAVSDEALRDSLSARITEWLAARQAA